MTASEEICSKCGKRKKEEWKCKRCGKCCRFITVPIQEPVDLDTQDYLSAHGIVYDGEKIIIPAVCKYLDIEWKDKRYKYKCRIHSNKFANCRLGGEKECEEALTAWKLLEEVRKEYAK